MKYIKISICTFHKFNILNACKVFKLECPEIFGNNLKIIYEKLKILEAEPCFKELGWFPETRAHLIIHKLMELGIFNETDVETIDTKQYVKTNVCPFCDQPPTISYKDKDLYICCENSKCEIWGIVFTQKKWSNAMRRRIPEYPMFIGQMSG